MAFDEAVKSSKSLTPFGFNDEVCLAIFGFTIIIFACFFLSRTKTMTKYIFDRAYFEHGPGREEFLTQLQINSNRTTSEVEDSNNAYPGNENVKRIHLDVKIKDDWIETKETKQKEVWLDVNVFILM
jgi:hypothetical protein